MKNQNEALRFLHETLGTEKGDALYQKVPKTNEQPFDFLEDFSAGQLSIFFRNESVAAQALVLSRLPPKLSAQVLANVPSEQKGELIRRIARMEEVSPEVLERAAATLREKARRFSANPDAEEGVGIDGMNTLAAILRESGLSYGDKLVDELEAEDSGLGRSLRNRLCTLEDVAPMPDRVLEEKLRSMTDHEVIFLLKNPLQSFTDKIRVNLSEGREQRIMEESEYLGPVSKIEVEAAAREFLNWFRVTGPWLE